MVELGLPVLTRGSPKRPLAVPRDHMASPCKIRQRSRRHVCLLGTGTAARRSPPINCILATPRTIDRSRRPVEVCARRLKYSQHKTNKNNIIRGKNRAVENYSSLGFSMCSGSSKFVRYSKVPILARWDRVSWRNRFPDLFTSEGLKCIVYGVLGAR